MTPPTAPTTVERLAGWAAELTIDDVPERVLALCRAQRRSVLSGIAASTDDAAASTAVASIALRGGKGDAVLAGADATVSVLDAVYGASIRSIALDFDDYACFGHTGHSSVVVPLVLGLDQGRAPGDADVVIAQVVANEIGLRLGGACLIGPLNGQLWSFVHAAGAALAAGRLLDLDPHRMAHALALALWQAPRPTVPGFMGSDAKLFTAAEPTVVGVRAAHFAADGVAGPLDILDHPHGFLDAFAHTPLPSVLGGLGDGWATETLSIKPYPGCAYIDTTVEALLSLGDVDPTSIERVDVEAGMLTTGMDALSTEYADREPPSPITVNFSIPWNVAIAIVAGRLTPAETSTAWMGAHHAQLADLANRVVLRHDWSLTARSAESFAPLLPPGALRDGVGTGALVRGMASVRGDHPSFGLGLSGMRDALRSLRTDRRSVAWRGGQLWDPEALAGFQMRFPARVRLTQRDGRVHEAEVDLPRGAAGHVDGPAAVADERWSAWSDLVPAAWQPAAD